LLAQTAFLPLMLFISDHIDKVEITDIALLNDSDIEIFNVQGMTDGPKGFVIIF
jgi:hypothetical protein